MIYTLTSGTYNYEINFLQSDPLYGYHVKDEQLKEMSNKYPAFASLLIVPDRLETHAFLDSNKLVSFEEIITEIKEMCRFELVLFKEG